MPSLSSPTPDSLKMISGWLKIFEKTKNPFFMIRSQIDIDLLKKKQVLRPGSVLNEDEVVETVRMELQKYVQNKPVYLISGCLNMIDRWDFEKLQLAITTELPDIKKNALTLSLQGYTTELIQRKYSLMEERIVYYAALSALGAVIPVGGVSIAVDTSLLLVMVREFADGFMLSADQLQALHGEISQTSEIVQLLNLAGNMMTQQFIMESMSLFATETVVEELSRFIPIIGTGIAASLSFIVTYKMAKKILDELKKIALDLTAAIVREKVNQDCFGGDANPNMV